MKSSLFSLLRNTLAAKEAAHSQPSGRAPVAVESAVRELAAAELRWVVGGSGGSPEVVASTDSPYRGW